MEIINNNVKICIECNVHLISAKKGKKTWFTLFQSIKRFVSYFCIFLLLC